jgi:hypothetical protein
MSNRLGKCEERKMEKHPLHKVKRGIKYLGVGAESFTKG